MKPTKRQWIRQALRERCGAEENWCWSWDKTTRLFYTLKACVCLLLGRSGKSSYKTADGDWVFLDTVSVAGLNFRKDTHWEYTPSASWDELAVGHGLFRNWFYETYWNGYP